jgi:hypothetical protein
LTIEREQNIQKNLRCKNNCSLPWEIMVIRV